MVKIFLDPGHGGSDPGAVGNGLQEKNLTLQIALAIRDILLSEFNNVEVRMSRTSDQTVSLNNRTASANAWKADLFLSIHINSGGGAGFETYIYPGVGRPTTSYRKAIHEEILRQVNFQNRGQKQGDYHVLRESNMDAVLTENGFIDNRLDAEKLKNGSFRANIARGHANGIARVFNLPRKAKEVTNPVPVTAPTEGLYKVQLGAFKNQNNANALSREARNKGFETYVLQEDGLYKIQLGAFKDKSGADALAQRARNAGLDTFVTT